MVSGVEAAGLVLGSIPLILAGLESYVKGIAVLKRFHRYQKEIEQIMYVLGAEHAMFSNSIQNLLIGVVGEEDVAELPIEPGGSRWKEPELDEELRKRLQNSYDSYMKSIGQMMEVTEGLKAKLQIDSSGKVQVSEPVILKKYFTRLKFSLKKMDYDEDLNKLRRANDSIHRMTIQINYFESRQPFHRTYRKRIPNYRNIKEKADGFHEVMKNGWSCRCSSHHSVNLCLEARMDHATSEYGKADGGGIRDAFHVLFHYGQQDAQAAGPAVSKIPWTWEEADVQVECKRVNTPLPPSCASQKGKGVRFAEQNMPEAVTAALAPIPDSQPIQDLCSTIHRLQKSNRDACFSLPAGRMAKQNCDVRIYPSKKLPLEPDSWSISTLRSLLGDANFVQKDRLKLAVTLASSVLQLSSTPWLEEDWGKDSILFVRRPDCTIYHHPFVSRSSVKSLEKSSVKSTSVNKVIKNWYLYALGIILIELWYRKPLSELQQAIDAPEPTGDMQLDFLIQHNAAERLADDLRNEAGGKYSDIVRRCIHCDFDTQSCSPDDIKFQQAVYQDVVAELQENYQLLFR